MLASLNTRKGRKAIRAFQATRSEANAAYERGDHRAALALTMVAVRKAPTKFLTQEDTPCDRFGQFNLYGSELTHHKDVVTKRDLDSLKKHFRENTEEPIIYRVRAAHAMGSYYLTAQNKLDFLKAGS